MQNKLRLILALMLIINTTAFPADSDKKKEAKPVPLTLFIPGIQQLNARQYLKGGLLLAAFAGSAAGAFIYNNKGNDLYNRYQDSTDVEEITSLRKQTERSFKKRNLFIIGIFSVWALHIIDLKFFKSPKASVKGEVGENNINIGIYYRF
jgi:hypothetical protein